MGGALGFIRLLATRQMSSYPAVITSNVLVSCACAVIMCASIVCMGLACNYRLPARFGIFLIVLYITYVSLSVLLSVLNV